MKRISAALLVAAALSATVSGCGGKGEEKGAKAAGGEVLPGTISDAMIDTSHSQAQAPLMPAKVDKPKLDLPGTDASEAADSPVAESAPAPTDAANPADVPKPAASPKPAATAKPKPAASKPAA
ncbi:hypothetical protein [Novosphingobium cyanobacteriorum]|uniref:Lipoprotein n=1 Tax=Novosphingobium cyanobacteriorum TaxID=3024215 RepID=A0ABT6CGM2_9SPHN|nr:hypothetical protein [Novosphingobium cyanobacteriorum]MDF8332967.1 hypothetical protein [Novosphingobium cyanobacteriorum]